MRKETEQLNLGMISVLVGVYGPHSDMQKKLCRIFNEIIKISIDGVELKIPYHATASSRTAVETLYPSGMNQHQLHTPMGDPNAKRDIYKRAPSHPTVDWNERAPLFTKIDIMVMFTPDPDNIKRDDFIVKQEVRDDIVNIVDGALANTYESVRIID